MGLTGCCGCFNLRDGSMAVGITMLVLSCLNMLGVIIGYAVIGSADNAIDQLNEEEHGVTEEDRQRAKAAVKILEYVLIPVLVIAAITVLINSLLVHGVRRDIKGMILAWLITYGILFGLSSAGSVIYLIMSFATGSALLIVLMLVGVAFAALYWYWWAVVLTHYNSLTSGAAGFNYSKDGVMLT